MSVNAEFAYTPNHVIPAKAGIQPHKMLVQNWIPAFAGIVRVTYFEDKLHA